MARLPVTASRVVLVGLAVAALIIGSVGGYLHQASVAHATCSDHGESVHVGFGPGALDHHEAASADTHLHPGGQAEGHGDAHEHCELGSAEAPRAAASERSPLAVKVSPPAERVALGAHVGTSRSLQLRLAPKTSPPAPHVSFT